MYITTQVEVHLTPPVMTCLVAWFALITNAMISSYIIFCFWETIVSPNSWSTTHFIHNSNMTSPKNWQFWPGLCCWRLEQEPNDRANRPGAARPPTDSLSHVAWTACRMNIIVWVLMAIFACRLSWHPTWDMQMLGLRIELFDVAASIVSTMNIRLEY